jgi:alkanesulfonate monooxygenase SsuD/methylene tetrahydromethanopterin reductase-like flavin-dependent oxidoreductase (luciferase family)
MNYGFVATSGSVHEIVELAVDVENAGWDGFFTWDGISVGDCMDIFDPWAILAAVAVKTERVKLGAMVFPLSRRRPWKVAREALTIDHLSNGRLVIPVGLGAIDDGGFSRVHPEVTDRRQRAELLDETLAILELAWSGEPVTFAGTHYQIEDVIFRPRPVQQPRIPIWVVGAWPSDKSMARAARWDGLLLALCGSMDSPSPQQVRDILAWVDADSHRTSSRPLEVVMEGVTSGSNRDEEIARLTEYADAGVTWWIESMWEDPHDIETLRARVRQGPPRP